MNTMKKSNEMNKGLRIKYLNIILLTLILSSLTTSMYTTFSQFFNSWNLNLLILIIITIPFIFGGILSGFITDKRKGVLGGALVGATSTSISIDLTLLINGLITLPTSEWSFYIPLGIIYTTPFLLGIGAVLGLIGSLVGILTKKWHDKRDKK